jgi:hypothetical protein
VGRIMRRSPAEKREIIHLVDHSELPVGRTLSELDVPRSPPRIGGWGSFYQWCQQCRRDREKGLEPEPSKRRQFCLSWRTRRALKKPIELSVLSESNGLVGCSSYQGRSFLMEDTHVGTTRSTTQSVFGAGEAASGSGRLVLRPPGRCL